MRSLRYSRKFLLLPYLAVFALIGIVGMQLLWPSSASPLANEDVVVSLSRTSYKVGETVRFTVTNRSTTTVTITNNCPEAPLEVYRRENDASWRQLHSKADERRCPNTLRSYDVAPAASVSADYGAWPDLFAKQGRYRLVVPLELQQLRPSVEFDVL